jgi:hypothetical protein
MHGGDGGADLGVSEGGEPAGALREAVFEVKAEGLEEDEQGKLLGDEGEAGAAGEDLLAHAVDEGSQLMLFGFAVDVDDGGELIEKEACMAAGKGEVSADAKAFAAAVEGGDAAVERDAEEGIGVSGREAEIAGEGEGKTAWEEKAVAGVETDGRFAVEDEPAGAGDDGVALDAGVVAEAEGPVAGEIKAASHVVVGLEESEDFGERVRCR